MQGLTDVDALVIGAGPAGTATAIWLASAGWRVVLAEQHRYPRPKVCGECVAPGNLGLLDNLGVGEEFRTIAGPPLQRVAWMSHDVSVLADLPSCLGNLSYGYALGRDRLDSLLLERARAVDVKVLQPARVLAVAGGPGQYECSIASVPCDSRLGRSDTRHIQKVRTKVVVDAHGSWESRLPMELDNPSGSVRVLRRESDLFAFKAVFQATRLAPGLLPVISFEGGYGGMVLADGGRTTIACCIRRDLLRRCRAACPTATAGAAVENHLLERCRGIREALSGSLRIGNWLSVGPLRPGIRLKLSDPVFRVGNAAGEAHPLIGEGISMAIQSAALLTEVLTQQPAAAIDRQKLRQIQRRYIASWRAQFRSRLNLAALYAHCAMRPWLSATASPVLRRWPSLLTRAARLAGKGKPGVHSPIGWKELA